MSDTNQPKIVIVQTTKSPGTAALLGFFFGPIGLLYSTVMGAVIMFIVNVCVGAVTFGFGLFLTWPVCCIWGYMAAKAYNKKIIAGSL